MAAPTRSELYGFGYDRSGEVVLDMMSNTWQKFKAGIPKTGRVFVISVEYENNPALISHKVYGSSEYWEVICSANNIIDPMTELSVGTRLFIPDLSAVLAAVPSQKQVQEAGSDKKKVSTFKRVYL